jgi:hypothetical protein
MTSFLLFLVTLSGLEIFADNLASTPQLTIVGGFISSLLFVFFLLVISFIFSSFLLQAVGNLQKETKWFEGLVEIQLTDQ